MKDYRWIELDVVAENLNNLYSQMLTVEGQLQAHKLTGAAIALREAMGRVEIAARQVGDARRPVKAESDSDK